VEGEEVRRRAEERRGKGVWVNRGSVRIEDKLWRWDEESDVLRDEKRNVREVERKRSGT